MNRITDLFEQFSLIEINLILRRTAFIGAAIAVAAVVAAGLLGHLLIGVGAFIGLALGLANIRLVTMSVAKAGASGNTKVRRIIASNTMLRLGVTTAVIFVLVFTVRDLGMGALGGVALFYFVFLANVMRALFQQGVTA
jgi:hypothetical protein